MPLIPHADLLAVHAAAVQLGLTRSRDMLLGGLDPSFVASLRVAPRPADQLLSDLDTLNGVDTLADGTVPLRVWLMNALALSSFRAESSVLRRALEKTAAAEGASPPQPARLTGPELKELSEALLSAFPSRAALARMLRFGLDKSLDHIASEGNLREAVFELLTAAEAEGWMKQLIEAAHQEVPGNPTLRAFVESHLPRP